jgi:hypothetical protein
VRHDWHDDCDAEVVGAVILAEFTLTAVSGQAMASPDTTHL